ncbi:MAG: hypothetical protein AB2L21_09085 [Anaerolineaceae bacterium]|jgi:hypothetical protein
MSEVKQIATPQEEIESGPANKRKSTIILLAVILVVALLIAGIVVLSSQPAEVTSKVRDIFIILLALEMFVIGVALIVLIVQLASLSNLLQNEVKPILNSTADTVNDLKGTVRFLSDNVSEPVIKMNQSLASVQKLLELLKFRK